MKLVTLKSRREFQNVRGGGRWAGAAFVLEGKARQTESSGKGEPRIGFTVTKKLGNAVARNRIRRRLREAVGQVAGQHARPGYDYVIVARDHAMTQLFADLRSDLERAFARVHQGPSGAPARNRTPRAGADRG